MFRALLREPLSLFALAGALVFGVYIYLDERASPPVTLTAETRAALVGAFEQLTGRAATPEEIRRIEQDYVADELLFREAVAQGLHLRSRDIRAEMIAEMRLSIAGLLPDPDDEALVNHYAENLAHYYAEPAISFRHVYFREPPEDPAQVLSRLRDGEEIAGDSFPQGREFRAYGRSMLRGLFGQAFLDALDALPLGEWHGPVGSTRGWHFVRAGERLAAHRLPFEQVRSQVEQDYLRTLIQQAVDAHVAEIAVQYGVDIER
jgi:hypothetical protein